MGYFLVFYGMQDGQPLISSRIILAQVIGRVCFPQNQAALLCQFKNSLNPEECDDANEEKLECQSAIVEDFQERKPSSTTETAWRTTSSTSTSAKMRRRNSPSSFTPPSTDIFKRSVILIVPPFCHHFRSSLIGLITCPSQE